MGKKGRFNLPKRGFAGLSLPIMIAGFANPSIATITELDFKNFDRPNYGLAISTLESTLALSIDIDDGVRDFLTLPDSVFSARLGLVLQAAETLSAIGTIVDVSTAEDVTELAHAVAGIDEWDPVISALSGVEDKLDQLTQNTKTLSGTDVAPPSDVEDAVVVSNDARSAAQKTVSGLNDLIAAHNSNLATLEEIQADAAEIAEGARTLSDVSLRVAEIIADSGLGGALYSHIIQLVGNALVLEEVSRQASDVESQASQLANRHRTNISVVQSALQKYNSALSRPLAHAEYVFTSIFPGSPTTRCGYTTHFSPNNFGLDGIDAIPRFLIGSYSVTLTTLDPEFQDGCQGTISVEATRSISGLSGLGLLTSTSTAALDYFYSVGIAGTENLYLLTLGQTVDFSGAVGESESFQLWGSIASPFEIIEVGSVPFGPPVYATTPEQQAAIDSILAVPEPSTSALFGIGLAFLALMTRSWRVSICRSYRTCWLAGGDDGYRNSWS